MMGILCVCFVDLKFKMTTQKKPGVFHSGHIEPSWGKKEPKLYINQSNCGTFMWFYGFCID